jgi:hypothetical protein
MTLPRTKILKRTTRNVDARLFLIATEGARTEPAYFERLREVWVTHPSRVHVEIVDAGPENLSAAQHVLERLTARAAELGAQEIDSCWLVFDIDRQPVKTLKMVAKEARQKGYSLAVSNPCFELWLLLHFADADGTEIKGPSFEKRLREVLGGYNKARLPAERFEVAGVEAAIERARGLVGDPAEAWPATPPATQVHRLVEELRAVQAR